MNEDIPIHDFRLVQGDTFEFTAYITDDAGVPIDITDWRVRMQIRLPGCGDDGIVAELSTDNGRITLDGPTGRMDARMATDDIPPDVYKYDYETTDTGNTVTTQFAGDWILAAQVTR